MIPKAHYPIVCLVLALAGCNDDVDKAGPGGSMPIKADDRPATEGDSPSMNPTLGTGRAQEDGGSSHPTAGGTPPPDINEPPQK